MVIFQIWIEHPTGQSFNGSLIQIAEPSFQIHSITHSSLPTRQHLHPPAKQIQKLSDEQMGAGILALQVASLDVEYLILQYLKLSNSELVFETPACAQDPAKITARAGTHGGDQLKICEKI